VLRKMAVPITNLSAEVRGTAGGADVGVEAEAGAGVEGSWAGGW
jgi:hypothetical protein